MLLPDVIPGCFVHHDVRNSFGRLLEATLRGHKICVAHGPLYGDDPAEKLLAPFTTSARQSGWRVETEEQLAPPHVTSLAQHLRCKEAQEAFARQQELSALDLLDDWGRAGLVLEIASRRGVLVHGRGLLHVRWRLRGTVTGRFGAEVQHGKNPDGSSWSFNPLTIPRDERHLVIPNGVGRRIVSIDFKAMDLYSMLSVVPGLSSRYADADDPHERTAQILFGEDTGGEGRDIAKAEIFNHAYGGSSVLRELFGQRLPELDFLRSLPHGEGARTVQRTSATAFRAGLSAALPLLLHDDVRPVMVVHDELVLDVAEISLSKVPDIARALEDGARNRIGQPYRTSTAHGTNYAECKT